MNNPLLSICIAAYNQPVLLERQLSSILNQTYRPLEIIISDDCSPISLEHIVEKIRSQADDLVFIKFTRQNTNLGVYWNALYCQHQITGKYALLTSHDDWFIDDSFISDAVQAIQSRDDCYIAIANAALENGHQVGMHTPMMNLFWYPGTPQWLYLDGRNYISNHLYGGMHPSYSSIVLDHEMLRKLGYFSFLSDKNSLLRLAPNSKLDFEPDEGFVCINMLASQGVVALSGKVVSIRGNPPGSWSKTQFWGKVAGLGVFFPCFQLYRFYRNIKFKEGEYKMLRIMILKYPVSRISITILRYFSFDIRAVLIMITSRIFYICLHMFMPIKRILR